MVEAIDSSILTPLQLTTEGSYTGIVELFNLLDLSKYLLYISLRGFIPLGTIKWLYSVIYAGKDRISLCTHFIYHLEDSQP